MTYRERYRSKLPHIQPIGETFFVTARLNGSLPRAKEQQLTEAFEFHKQQLATIHSNQASDSLSALQQQYFADFDELVEKTDAGPHWLLSDEIASVVSQAFHFWDNNAYELIAFCIMSNHFHVVFRLCEYDSVGKPVSLDRIMHSIKSFTANRCNKVLNRTGHFWEHESYDRLIRDQNELYHTIQYVLNNPVKANLCQDWRI